MRELKFELTKEQEEAIQRFAYSISEFFEKVWYELKRALEGIAEAFRDYIMSLQPKQRYKFLKATGIKKYVRYFRRNGIIRCRNNC